MTVAQISTALALIGTIGGGAYWLDNRYAKVEQVAEAGQQIMPNRIWIARQSGDRVLLRSLCDDFYRLYRWTPSPCK